MKIVSEKISLAQTLLKKAKIDLWLLFVRETPLLADPLLPLLVGHGVTWESIFAYSAEGEAIALVGELDSADFTRSKCFSSVLTYRESLKEPLIKMLERLNPKTIGVNFSTDDPSSDGLTHGMYLLLSDYLKETVFADRLCSAAPAALRLRSRKSETEIERLTKALALTETAWEKTLDFLRPGLSEREIGSRVDQEMIALGVEPSFPTIVNAGSKTQPGHSLPTDAILEPGDLLHIDFGVRYDDYCSDIQRLVYFKKPHEDRPPEELTRAFETIVYIISKTAEFIRPGMAGWQVDNLAREILTERDYPHYQHALGHQLGRGVHDGGAILGPNWPRYGNTPNIPIDENSVFTLELEIILEGIGCVGLEEDVLVGTKGATFLGNRQQELIVK